LKIERIFWFINRFLLVFDLKFKFCMRNKTDQFSFY
jgi:hypothetical protein